jgi:hypothetical protein
MKRVWKEVFAFLATFGPALLAVLLDTLRRKDEPDGKGRG